MNPMPPQQDRPSFWKTTGGVLTAAGTFIAAVAGLITALAATGVLHPTGGSPPSSSSSAISLPPSSSSAPGPSPVVDTSTAAPGRASIVLVYSGDTLGCSLQLDFLLSGQSIQPTGNRFTVRNVSTGPQPYSVAGTISCAAAGFCTADGSGTIDVVDGHSYSVRWLNTAVGSCAVSLDG